jgi:predicted nucleic acid-binding protein
MTGERFFLDTAFIQAILNRRDHYHTHAKAFLPRIRAASEVWVTEAVLVEVGNALGALDRQAAAHFIRQCYSTPNLHVVSLDRELFLRALLLYQSREDKTWGLTDCISFTVMTEQDLHEAITTDTHYIQAGYRALLLEARSARRSPV